MAAQFEWEFPSVVQSEELLLERVQAALRENRIDLDDERRLLLALSEAFNNAMIHGNQLDPDKSVKVRLRINERTIFADITDQGQQGLEKLRMPRPDELLAEGGRGVTLMMYSADDIDFEPVVNGGLRVSVTVRRRQCADV